VTSQKQGTGEVFGVASQNGVCASPGVVRAVPYEEATRDLVLDGKGECMLLDFSGLVLSDHLLFRPILKGRLSRFANNIIKLKMVVESEFVD
jgi:hypothetical protein